MSGTVDGGLKAAETNRKKYGPEFYKNIGRAGGLKSRGGGFASSHEKAVEAGKKGGSISRGGGRKPAVEPKPPIKPIKGFLGRMFKEKI